MSAPLADSSAPPTLAEGVVIAGRYKILGLIGTGGMGAVYRAEHVHMRKTVALKLLHPEFLKVPEVVQRFEREAIAAGRIEHSNVVAASDFGKLDDGSFYLVLEYIDGTSLRALLEKGPLPAARAIRIAYQTTLALGAAHAAGVVHRDLKPDNVMLIAEPDGTDRVKVLDFGIARVSSPDARRDATQLTRVGMVMGTIAYMSPEQAVGQEVDHRTDLYSLGVMLYEMIAGVIPFDAELPSQVLARQLVEAPPPLPAGTAPALAELVYDLMEKKAEDRPASAQIVLQRLAALTPTPSGRVPAPKPAVPRPVIYGVGAAAFLLGVLAFALGGKKSEAPSASAEPSASSAPERIEAKAEPSAAAPSVEPASSAPATPAAPVPSATATPASPDGGTKAAGKPAQKGVKGGTKGKGATPTPTAEQRPAPAPAPQRKKTGPGGIYIPPPSEWFK